MLTCFFDPIHHYSLYTFVGFECLRYLLFNSRDVQSCAYAPIEKVLSNFFLEIVNGW